MAELRDLAGLPCGVHPGGLVDVAKSGNTAVCRGGAYDAEHPSCKTAQLKAYAASLNGSLKEQKSPPPEEYGGRGAGGRSQNGVPTRVSQERPTLLDSRVPPNSEEAEMSVLGAVLIAPATLDEALRILKPDDFYREIHRMLFKAMVAVRDKGAAVDLVTLTQQLGGKAQLEKIGGNAKIAEIVAFVPSAHNIAHYAGIVRDLALKRRIIVEATNLIALANNGVSADGLIGEANRTLRALDDTGPSNLPSFEKTQIDILSWDEMRIRRAAQVREWAVEGWLARGETSSWSGKVEGGKTTLMRELTMAIVRGEPFLGRHTAKGRVFYAMLDADGEGVTYDEFEKLGFDQEDAQSVQFLFEPMLAQIKGGLEQFIQKLHDFKPTLVIIDPYARLKQIEDFHSYSNTYLMGMLSEIAKRLHAHLALPGHIPRGRSDDDDVATAGFGSISFSGGVNARFVVTNREGTHTIRTSRGKAAGFEPLEGEHLVLMDDFSHRITLGDLWSWKDKGAAAKTKVLDFFEQNTDRPFDVVTLAREVRIQRSIVRGACNMLYGNQKIKRAGDGLKSKPYIYSALSYSGAMTMEEVKRE